VNIYLGPLPQPWKGPVQVRGPEASASLAAWLICSCSLHSSSFNNLLGQNWSKTGL